MELLSRMEVVLVRPELIVRGIELSRLHQLSFGDALVLTCASAAGCKRVLTEDLQDGGVLAGIRIENPFAG